MKTIKIITVLSLSFLLAACTATPEECDPSVELNVFSKAACQFSGSYQQRVDEKEITLNAENQKQGELNKGYAKVKKQQSAVHKKVANQSAKLNQLKQEIAKTKKQIEKVKNNPSLSVAEKEKELQRLQSILSAREAEAEAALDL